MLVAPGVAAAQVFDLPSLSPRAKVEQRVGVTDFALEYSSPAVKKRKIWGELVPYNEVWRAGANAATKLTASKDFTFGGTAVKAGSYSVFMIPTKAAWTVHLNSDLNANQGNHDAKKDVAKISVKPVAIPARERLLYFFNNATDDKVSLELEWEKIRIAVPIGVDTKAHVEAAIKGIDGAAWRGHSAAAAYIHETGDSARALTLIDRSVAIQSTWRNEWQRAQILWKLGKKPEAIAAAKKAQSLGGTDTIYEQFFKADIAKAVNEWK
jgi:hypothetical protein